MFMNTKLIAYWKLLGLVFIIFLAACSDDGGEVTPTPDPDPDSTQTPVEIPDAFLDFGGEGDNSEAEIIGVEIVEGRNGGDAYLFNAVDSLNECGQPGGSYIKLPTIGAVWEEGFTVAAWVEFQEIRNFERIIDLGNGRGDNEDEGMNITFSRVGKTNNLAITSWISTDSLINRTTGRLIAQNTIINNEMHFYAATISPSGEMKIYVDGALVAEKVDGHPVMNISRSTNFIGRSNWCSEDPDFKGIIDDVNLFNTVLSGEQIAALYEN